MSRDTEVTSNHEALLDELRALRRAPGRLTGHKIHARPKLVAIIGNGDAMEASSQMLWALKYAKRDKYIEAAAVSMGWKQGDDVNVLERLEVIREKYDHEDTRTARRWSEIGFIKLAELLGSIRQDLQPIMQLNVDESSDGVTYLFTVATLDDAAEARPRVMIDNIEFHDFEWTERTPDERLGLTRSFWTVVKIPHRDQEVMFYFPDFSRVRIITRIDTPSYKVGTFSLWTGVSVTLTERVKTTLRLDRPSP